MLLSLTRPCKKRRKMKSNTSDLTPLMRQYSELKKQHPDAILFFQVGDFYEMFYEDATLASRVLNIALTARDKSKEDPVPLCGIPVHAATSYIAKLIKCGYTVGICNQMEDPSVAKGIMRREVVRIITPGTLIEPELLEAKENNYIAACSFSREKMGLSYLDLSTGMFCTTEWTGEPVRSLEDELSRIEPQELLLSEESDVSIAIPPSVRAVHRWSSSFFDYECAYHTLTSHFKTQSVDGFGCGGKIQATCAAGALLSYVSETQKGSLSHIGALHYSFRGDTMILDPTTQKTLETVRRSDGKKEGSLLGVLDLTLTPMGARMLKEWLLRPLINLKSTRQRQEGVEELFEESTLRVGIRKILGHVSDLERLISRISLKAAHARDLVTLKRSLSFLPDLRKLLSSVQSDILVQIREEWDECSDISRSVEEAIVDTPPPSVKEGGVIKWGFDPDLDEIRQCARQGKEWIRQIEAAERARTGIDSLKVRYNQVFGYYIEITRAHFARVPPEYQRKQTLVNAERFTTEELTNRERDVLGAEERARQREAQIFEEILERIAQEVKRVQRQAQLVALLDLLSTLAESASQFRYTKPHLHEGLEIRIIEGRHPILDILTPGTFVPNDTLLDGEDNRLLIVTGPNMAGKSTYLRQVALIVLMAQIGSFVPAKEASIGIVDRIYTRVGAADNISAGQSTFMVEMNETAQILHHATKRSLILFDEIGRGTSTFDGLAIAWAVAEYVLDDKAVGARTLFATHYHELITLSSLYPGVKTLKAEVQEWNDEIIFLKRIIPGASDRSYGIHVARLAGLPPVIITRAKQILSQLEGGTLPRPQKEPLQQNLFTSREDPLRVELRQCDPLRMTPLEALTFLCELHKKAMDRIDPLQEE